MKFGNFDNKSSTSNKISSQTFEQKLFLKCFGYILYINFQVLGSIIYLYNLYSVSN